MDAGTVLAFVQLGILLGNLVAQGYLERQKVDTALGAFAARWKDMPPTPENLEAARMELLEQAGYPNPREDPYIQARLAEIGTAGLPQE